MSNNFTKEKPDEITWQKFELFYYPLGEDNDLFVQLRTYFSFFKQQYTQLNHIDSVGERIDLVKIMIDKNYGVLGNKLKANFIAKVKGKKDIDEEDPQN